MYKIVLLIFFMSCKNMLCAHNTSKSIQEKTTPVFLSSNTVAIDFYQIISQGDQNVLFCPASLNIILAMATISARGNTAKELKSALHLEIENEEIKSGYKELLKNIGDKDLKLATRLFLKKGVVLQPEFVKTAQTYFNSDVQAVDFSNAAIASKIINTFVEENTNNKIHDLVSAGSLSSSTSLLLVNAAHFKGEWLHKFDLMFDKEFHITKDKKVQTKMMQHTGEHNYAEIISLDAKVVQIPFKTGEYSMLILLPNKIDGLFEVEKKLKYSNMEGIYNNLTKQLVQLTMPKFSIEKKVDLKSVCEKLGIPTLFTSEADLSGLAKDRIAASGIIQKTLIKVDDVGVEAVAATGCNEVATMKQLTHVNVENPSADPDTSRVLLMNDEGPTFFDRFLEAFKLKPNSKNSDCSDSIPIAAASETKEVEVAGKEDEDWFTTMVKDFDKFVASLGEDGDLSSSLGLEEGSAESGSKADYQKQALKEAREKMRAPREAKNLKNKLNSRGHKMAIELGNRPRSRRSVTGVNKAGLVLIPNQKPNKKVSNRAEVVTFKTKRELLQSKGSNVPQRVITNKVELLHRQQREIHSLVGTNKAGLILFPKQDKSKAGSNRIEVVADDLSKHHPNVLSTFLSKRNTMTQKPLFRLIHPRQITLQTDNPNLIHTSNNKQFDSNSGQNTEKALINPSESNQVINNENHAPSVPFLSSSNSGKPNLEKESSLTSKIPGIPNDIPALVRAGGGNPSATAVVGGFTMMLMPMPEMSLSNLQNVLQSGQQISQLIPALPS